VSTDDTEQQKRLKSETKESAQVRLFIQCNETISKTSNNKYAVSYFFFKSIQRLIYF